MSKRNLPSIISAKNARKRKKIKKLEKLLQQNSGISGLVKSLEYSQEELKNQQKFFHLR